MRRWICFLIFDFGCWLEVWATPKSQRDTIRASLWLQRNRLEFAWDKLIEPKDRK